MSAAVLNGTAGDAEEILAIWFSKTTVRGGLYPIESIYQQLRGWIHLVINSAVRRERNLLLARHNLDEVRFTGAAAAAGRDRLAVVIK